MSMAGPLQSVLESELQRLKDMFHRGHDLTVRHLPGQIRTGENGGVLAGEVQNMMILIYEDIEDKAISTLYHEFVEACFIVPLTRNFYRVINHLQKVNKEKDN